MTHTKLDADCDVDMTTIWQNERIRSIAEKPAHLGGGFLVTLKCGGYGGHGATIGQAIADAKALNADYLEMTHDRP